MLELCEIVDPKYSLHRFGRKNDGGYIMAYPMSREKIAYSIGISNDVSWDKDVALEGYDIYMYDHTIDSLPEEMDKFHWEKIGIRGYEDIGDRNLVSLRDMLDKNGHSKTYGMVLKMDVEGAEWDVLESIGEELNNFDQITMEIHGLLEYKRKDRILASLEKLTEKFAVIHIHGNNWNRVEYTGYLVTPDVLEVTLVNRNAFTVKRSDKILPLMIDEQNDIRVPDIRLGRWNV